MIRESAKAQRREEAKEFLEEQEEQEEQAGGTSAPAGGETKGRPARLAGLEPATTGLEGRCSIQLSYRRGRCLGKT